jgi:hypothetical protein
MNMAMKFHEQAAKRLSEIADPHLRRACTWFYEQVYFEEPAPACDFDLDYFVRLVLRALSHPAELIDLLEGRTEPSEQSAEFS